MRKFLVVLGVVALGALLHKHFEQKKAAAEVQTVEFTSTSDDLLPEREDTKSATASASADRYRCDGRDRCPQMHSCEEATWFLQNCPGMKMDGDGDGIPCEQQFCGQSR